MQAMNQADNDAGDDPEGQEQTEAHEWFPFAHDERHQQGGNQAHSKCPAQAYCQFRQACLFPARKRARGRSEKPPASSTAQIRPQSRAGPPKFFRAKRIHERADKAYPAKHCPPHHQQHIIGEQHATHAKPASNLPPSPILGARHANSSSEPPMMTARKARMKMPRLRIGRKSVHRSQHAGAHQEGAEQAERECA